MAALKGQNFRVFLGTDVVAESTNCVITLTGNTEASSTKNDVDNTSKPEIVSKSWQVQVDSLDVSDIGVLVTAMKSGTVFAVSWKRTSTADNVTPVHTSGDESRYGDAILVDATFTFNDRQNCVKSITFQGTGPLSKYEQSN